MEYIVGDKIINWAKKSDTKSSEIRSVIINVLRNCFLLDYVGLDHGELSTIDKHVIVGNGVKTTFTAKARTNGLMAENSRDHMKTIK